MAEILERYLTRREEKQLFACVRARGDIWSRRDAAWMALMRHTGGRVSSIAALTVGEAQQALAEKRIQFRDEAAKKGRGYSAFCNREARKALRMLLAIRKRLGASLDIDAPLIVSRNHRALSVRSFQARMQYWRDAAGLDVAASPHWFRHTLGRRLVEQSTAGAPLLIAQSQLGHASLKNTTIYTRPTREDVALAMEMQA